MDERIFSLPDAPLPLNLNSYYEVLVPDGASATGYTSCKIKLRNIDGIKRYKGKITQVDITTDSGLLIIGKEYVIYTLETGDDFTNVGYITPGTKFTATATTPTVWANNTIVLDVADSAPTVVLLENTIGNIVWTYSNKGIYLGTLASAFTDPTKVWFNEIPSIDLYGKVIIQHNDSNSIYVATYKNNSGSLDSENNLIDNSSLLIEVYP